MSQLSISRKFYLCDPANISTLVQSCFNVVNQRWNNVDSALKMKQNPTLGFQCCTTLIQRQTTTLKQRRNNVGTHVFSCEFDEISNNTSFTEHLWTTASIFTILIWRKTKLNLLFLEKVKQKTTEQQNW